MFPIGQGHNKTPHFLFLKCMTDVCLEYVMLTKAILTHSLDKTDKNLVLGNLNNHMMLPLVTFYEKAMFPLIKYRL